ncbi:MAG: hypothetical protein ACR2F9_00925, partial [Longimicrobiaceae bacterium]
RADLIMRSYGTLFTFLVDSPGNVERRTGNWMSRGRARALQRELRGLEIEPPSDADWLLPKAPDEQAAQEEAHDAVTEAAPAEATDTSEA